MSMARSRRPAKAQRRLHLPALPWRTLTLATGAALALLLGAGAVIAAVDRPVSSIAIAGRFQRVSAVDVERAVRAQVQGTGLLRVNLARVAESLRSLPWVDQVTVQRAWPGSLSVHITEQVPAARWGESGLLNTRGELFAPDERHIPPELARLTGPEGTQAVVARRFLTIEGRLEQAGLHLTALRLDARGAWELDLANGVTVRLGRHQVDERLERFFAAAARLVTQRGADIAYVDMRYTNGFAIGWRGSRPAASNGAHDA